MTDHTAATDELDPVRTAVNELRHLTECRCEVDYTARGRHHPRECASEYRPDVDTLAAAAVVNTATRRRDLDTEHPTIPDLSMPNGSVARNVLASTAADLHGWLPLSVRYEAAEAALDVVHAWIQERELGGGSDTEEPPNA